MENSNNTQNTTYKVQFKQVNTEQLMNHLQERFKRYRESNKTIEEVPIKEEKEVSQSLKSADKPYGPMTGKTGRPRLGYYIGLYFNTKPYMYNNGGAV